MLCARKVLSDNPGRVEFQVGLVDSIHHLSDSECVVPENIHTSPMEGIFSKTPPHPPGNSNRASHIFLNFFWS